MTYYQILEVPTDASEEEIKASYRRLVKAYHPDVNPSPQAAEIIRLLTESYDVLSNSYRRQVYDINLGIGSTEHIPQKQETEEERYRREFKQRRNQEEQVREEKLFRLKSRFYQVQRWSQVFFVSLGIIFSIDYYRLSDPVSDQIVNVRDSRLKGSRVYLENHTFISESKLFFDHLDEPVSEVQILHSSVFGIPTRLQIERSGQVYQYRIYRNLHDLNNIFPLVLLGIGIVLLFKRHYTDWALTLGIISFLVGVILLMSITLII